MNNIYELRRYRHGEITHHRITNTKRYLKQVLVTLHNSEQLLLSPATRIYNVATDRTTTLGAIS